MGLQEKLLDMKKAFESKIPPDALAIMHRATEDLLHSGIMDRVLKVGAQAPAFTLPNAGGEMVRSSDLLTKGPLAVSFYRGVW